jgi:hypothetical protein
MLNPEWIAHLDQQLQNFIAGQGIENALISYAESIMPSSASDPQSVLANELGFMHAALVGRPLHQS